MVLDQSSRAKQEDLAFLASGAPASELRSQVSVWVEPDPIVTVWTDSRASLLEQKALKKLMDLISFLNIITRGLWAQRIVLCYEFGLGLGAQGIPRLGWRVYWNPKSSLLKLYPTMVII